MPSPPPITSRSNARVKALRASLSGEARHPGDLLGLEGPNLIGEAHAAGYAFETLFFREGSEALSQEKPWLAELRAEHRLVLSRDVFDSTLTTRSPQGVAATCILRELAPRSPGPTNTLVLERVQDPGNLGTLLRSAESFGIPRVMVTDDTANQWNPKVVRAGAGAVLRTPIQRATVKELLGKLRAEGTRIFAAVAHFSDTRNSGRPAASFSYDAVFPHPCAILIGNEGSGLSEEALSLADEQVLIPGNGSESLNAAVAGSILMYECMRETALRLTAGRQGRRA